MRFGRLMLIMGAMLSAAPARAQTMIPVSFDQASAMWGEARVQIAMSVDCAQAHTPGCEAAAPLLASLADKPFSAKLDMVNRWVNARPYVRDEDNWDRADYWESLDQFVLYGGDCEDFAIAKYALLRALGVPASAMQVVVARDPREGDIHAFLIVQTENGSLWLDNRESQLMPSELARPMDIRVAVNEEGLWRSESQPLVPAAAAAR